MAIGGCGNYGAGGDGHREAGLVDHRDVADVCMRILLDPATWGQHYDLTGPELLSWPDAMRLLAAETGEPVTFQTTSETEMTSRLTSTGRAPAGPSCS
jgi:uncharacterized protein YbjT (DUF2867 family)